MSLKVKWNRKAARKIRTSRESEAFVDQVARQIAARTPDTEVLPNSNRSNRAGSTIYSYRRGHKSRMRLLASVRK